MLQPNMVLRPPFYNYLPSLICCKSFFLIHVSLSPVSIQCPCFSEKPPWFDFYSSSFIPLSLLIQIGRVCFPPIPFLLMPSPFGGLCFLRPQWIRTQLGSSQHFIFLLRWQEQTLYFFPFGKPFFQKLFEGSFFRGEKYHAVPPDITGRSASCIFQDWPILQLTVQ